MNLIGLILLAGYRPVVGVQRRWPATAHAVTDKEVAKGWPKARTVAAACGRRVAIPYPPILWPPRRPAVLCSECAALHGSKRFYLLSDHGHDMRKGRE